MVVVVIGATTILFGVFGDVTTLLFVTGVVVVAGFPLTTGAMVAESASTSVVFESVPEQEASKNNVAGTIAINRIFLIVR